MLPRHTLGIQLHLLEVTSDDPSKVLEDPHQSQFYILILWIVSPAEQLGKIIEINYLKERSVRRDCALCDITNGLPQQKQILKQGLPKMLYALPPITVV